jgi:hypothetical protein
MQYDTNGYKVWGHGGDTLFFHSDLWMVPDANFGFYISYNSSAPKPGGGRGEVLRALFDRYFPGARAELHDNDFTRAAQDARAVSGSYEVTRRSEKNFLKILAIFGAPEVSANNDGTILVDTAKNIRGEVKHWREIAPLVYQEVGGVDKIAFRRDASGRVMEMLPQPCIYEAQRSRWFDAKGFLKLTLLPAVSLILTTALLWPVAALVRRRYHAPVLAEPRQRRLFLVTRFDCLVSLLWLATLAYAGGKTNTDVAMIGDGMNPWLRSVHLLGWLFVALTFVTMFFTFSVWRLPEARLWLKAHSTLLTLSSLILIAFAWHVHLLDPSLRF